MKRQHSGSRLVAVGGLLAATMACSLGGAGMSETFDGSILIPVNWVYSDPGKVNVESLPDDAESGIKESVAYSAWDDEAPEDQRSTLDAIIVVYDNEDTAAQAFESIFAYNLALGAQSITQPGEPPVEEIVVSVTDHSDLSGEQIYTITMLSCRTVLRYDIVRYDISTADFVDFVALGTQTLKNIHDLTCA
jgi:hypothetical protein